MKNKRTVEESDDDHDTLDTPLTPTSGMRARERPRKMRRHRQPQNAATSSNSASKIIKGMRWECPVCQATVICRGTWTPQHHLRRKHPVELEEQTRMDAQIKQHRDGMNEQFDPPRRTQCSWLRFTRQEVKVTEPRDEIPVAHRAWTCPTCHKGLPGHLRKHEINAAIRMHYAQEHPTQKCRQEYLRTQREQAAHRKTVLYKHLGHSFVSLNNDFSAKKGLTTPRRETKLCTSCRHTENTIYCAKTRATKRAGAQCTPDKWEEQMTGLRPTLETWRNIVKQGVGREYAAAVGR